MKDIDKIIKLFQEVGVYYKKIDEKTLAIQTSCIDNWIEDDCCHTFFMFDESGKYIDVDC